MKNLELELQKRLLIVERNFNPVKIEVINNVAGDQSITLHLYKDEDTFVSYSIVGLGTLKFICNGDELTEEIAKEFATKKMYYRQKYYKDFIDDRNHLISPIKSFISSVEAKGYYWGDNPFGKEKPEIIEGLGVGTIDLLVENENWKQVESRTFNPGKTLIFEIRKAA